MLSINRLGEATATQNPRGLQLSPLAKLAKPHGTDAAPRLAN